MSATPTPAGQRRPSAEEVPALLELVSEGKSLRSACIELGLHCPSMSDFLHADEGRREQYARAKEQRAEVFQEKAIDLGMAAATGVQIDHEGAKHSVDPAGARVALEAIKWAAARMAPKTAPVQRIDFSGQAATLPDEELAARIAALEAQGRAED